MAETLRDALEEMRTFAAHRAHCIFVADLSGGNGDEWAGDNARRCNCGFDDALALYDAVLAAVPTPAIDRHEHRFDVVIRDDAHMRLLGCSNTPCEETYQWDW